MVITRLEMIAVGRVKERVRMKKERMENKDCYSNNSNRKLLIPTHQKYLLWTLFKISDGMLSHFEHTQVSISYINEFESWPFK